MAKACTKPSRLVVKRERTGAKLPAMAIGGPVDAVRAARDLIANRAYEVFLVLYLNVRGCVAGYEELTMDSVSEVAVDSASLVRNALLSGSPAIITVHQHPSGSLEPSGADEHLWRQIREQCRIMGITVLDNFIVTEEGYFSEEEGRSTVGRI